MRWALVGGLVAAAAILTVLAVSAQDGSPEEPRSGWRDGLRRELGLIEGPIRECRKRLTPAMIRRQDRVDRRDPDDDLRAAIPDSGGAWFDACDEGRVNVGIPSRPDVRERVLRARRFLAASGMTQDVRLVAVRSSYAALARGQERLGEPFERLLSAGLASSGIDTRRNAVIVEVASSVSAADWRALAVAAQRVRPARVLLERSEDADLSVELL